MTLINFPHTNGSLLQDAHPLYRQFAPTWAQALDVYEGTGGFLDPKRPYLVAHPREWLDHSVAVKNDEGQITGYQPNPNPRDPSPKLRMRWKLARYENIAEAILDTVASALFEPAVTRTISAKSPERAARITSWWTNADGRHTPMDDWMQDSWITAAVFGHCLIVADIRDDGTGQPKLCRYTPLDVLDWLEDEDGNLAAVKLLEPEPRTSFEQRHGDGWQVRIITADGWQVLDRSGKVIDEGEHGFGRLPVEILYGRRRPLTPLVGKTIMGDPGLYIDKYNLDSEIRELLRNQTFALLNVPVGKDGSAETEREMMGRQSGTSSVLLSTNPAAFISPSGDNVKAYHEAVDRLVRMTYRLARVPWESDSRDAESADSRRIKRQEMNDSLVKYAGEMERAERGLLELGYRALYADRWEIEMQRDEVGVVYPDSFNPPDMLDVVERAVGLIGMELGETFTRELKKAVVRDALPLSPEMLKQIEAEIEAADMDTTDKRRGRLLAEAVSRFGARPAEESPEAI